MADPLYFNGRFTTTDERVLGVEDRGFQFGDAVYEVVKYLGKRLVFWREHFHRMSQGLDELGIRNPWSEASFLETARDLLRRTAEADGMLYMQVSRGEAPRAHFYPENISPTVVAYTRKFAFADAAKKERGIHVITTPDIRWKYCNVKSTNLLGNSIAKKKAQRAGVDEALFLLNGEVTEGASSSFFAITEGKIVTHPADAGILAGTVRDHVISLAIFEKIRLDERPILEIELFNLDEAFITATSQSVMPVTEIDGRTVGSGRRGPVTERLQALYDALEREEAARFE